MKILQLCNRVPFPLVDGGAIAMFAMTKTLADKNCEVHTLALNTKKHYVDSNTLPDWFTSKTKLFTVDADTGVKATGAFMNLFSKDSYNLIRFDIPAYHEKLRALLLAHNYDVVQLEGLFLSMYIPTIRSCSSAIISMRAHNVEFMIWERMAATTTFPLKKWYLNLLAKRLKREEIAALQQVDCLVPISEIDASQYKQLGLHSPTLVCTAGVDDALLSLKQDDFEIDSVFHLAAMNWQPNLQAVNWFMDTVWPQLRLKFPAVKLYLAGKDMPKEYYLRQTNQVAVMGKIENAQAFMLSKNIMIVPLLSGSGMRIKIIEGLALGKVIVSTSIGAEGIACEHKKNILIANTAEEFVVCISIALTDKLLCAELSRNAKELVRQTYSNTSIVSRLISFYQTLLATKKSIAK